MRSNDVNITGISRQLFETPTIRQQKPQSVSANVDPLEDLFSASSEKSDSYLIIPKKDGSVETREMETLLGLDSGKKLPLIGAFMADLDENAKTKLKSAGYMVIPDKVENWLPENNIGESKSADLINDSIKAEVSAFASSVKGKSKEELKKMLAKMLASQPLKGRPVLQQSRFDTELTRQYQGQGVTIAVIDSGIYPHPDLTYPENRLVAFVDFVNGKKVPYDDNGHGTHVAGDAAGSGALSDGLYKGSAPKANIIGLKALSGAGGGKTSDVIKAIQWCVENREKYNIRVVNMSLGHQAYDDYKDDPTNIAVKAAREAGLIIVAAAGNSGNDRPGGVQTVGAPGDSPDVITVGAADDFCNTDPTDDIITGFSSKGPTVDGRLKPDISAPGEAIVSLASPNSKSDGNAQAFTRRKEKIEWLYKLDDVDLKNIPDEEIKSVVFNEDQVAMWKKGPVYAKLLMQKIYEISDRYSTEGEGGVYQKMPGTSMASPIVAGVVAQMLSANPDLTPDQVADILKTTADKIEGEREWAQGYGMVDPDEAISQSLKLKEEADKIAAEKAAEKAERKARRLAEKAEKTSAEKA